MKKKFFLLILALMTVICTIGFIGCGGAFAMDEFVVDTTEFAKIYEVGDEVDLSKLSITAKFNDGTSEEIPLDRVSLYLDGNAIGLNELSKITEKTGTVTLEIKYSDFIKPIVITVNAKHVPVLSGVRFDKTNVQTEYTVKDAVTLEGLKLYALYDNDTIEREITLSDVEVYLGQEKLTGGYNKIAETVTENASVKFKYRDYYTEILSIKVNDKLDRVVFTEPTTKNYKVGDVISPAGITATAEYRSGKRVKFVNDSDIKYFYNEEEISGENVMSITAKKGDKVIVAKAEKDGFTATQNFTITVANFVNGIELDTENAVLEYIVGTTVDISEIKINVSYADNTDNKQIGLTAEGVVCKNANGNVVNFNNVTNTAGEKAITVYYEGYSDTFTLTVADAESALETLAVTGPTKTEYNVNDTADFAGLTLTASYKAEFETEDEVIPVNQFAAKGVSVFFDDELITDYSDVTNVHLRGSNAYTVVVQYLGKTAEFTITVNNPVEQVEFDYSKAKTDYKIGEIIDPANVVAKAVYKSGDKDDIEEIIFYFNGEAIDYDNILNVTATAGNKTVVAKAEKDGVKGEVNIPLTVSDYVTGISFGSQTTFTCNVNVEENSVYGFADLEVYANYRSENKIKLETEDYSFENNGITVPTDGKIVTVKYGDFTGEVTLIVKDVLTGLTVTNVPNLSFGSSAFDGLKNVTVTRVYTYKGNEVLTILQEGGDSFIYALSFYLKNDGGEYEALTQLELNTITAKSGVRELRLIYTENGKEVSCDFTVTVTAPMPGVNGYSKPTSALLYEQALVNGAKEDKSEVEFENSFFVDGSEEYLVGDDNPFKFVPVLSQINIETEERTTLANFKTDSQVFYDGLALEVREENGKKIYSRDGVDYVVEDYNNNTFDFTEAAIGKRFTLKVLPSKDVFNYGDAVKAVEWTVTVVDGYNVHDSKELCLLEQSDRNYWDGIKAELGLTGISPEAIILHQNTIITKDSIPEVMYYTLPEDYNIKYKFNDTLNVCFDGEGNLLDPEHMTVIDADNKTISCAPEYVPEAYGGPLSRTFLWDAEWSIFEYNIQAGKTFTLYGNYFDLNASKLPLVAAFDPAGVSVSDYTIPNDPDDPHNFGMYYGMYMSKLTLLAIYGLENTKDAADETFNFENFAVKGNAAINQVLVDGSSNITKGADSPIFGGGIIFVKSHYCTSNIENVHAHACFIPFFSRNGSVVNYTNVKAYDSFQDAMYIHSDTVTTLTNCYMKRSGGPIAILTEEERSINGVDTLVIPYLYVDDESELETLITGQEQWFTTQGVTGQVAQLAALDPLFNGYFGKSIFNGEGKFNVLAVNTRPSKSSIANQAYMQYKDALMDRIAGHTVYETMQQVAYASGGAMVVSFNVGDQICFVYSADGVNYSLVYFTGAGFADISTNPTLMGAFMNADYIVINAGEMSIVAGFFPKA